ncbi:MAG: prepilin peptidase [Lachnospiraceae bacterium]|nr:prepilin peptidase [Lachnospiraceae bacterium]
MQTIIIRFTICLVYYILGAYATTDILRLLKGSTLSINNPDCYCPICNNKIKLKDQLPIFAYIKNHGACHYCKSKIPFGDLFLEIFLFLLMTLITILLHFNWWAYFVCFIAYEVTKLLFLFIYGPRETEFAKNLLRSLGNNMVLFTLLAVLFLLAQLA